MNTFPAVTKYGISYVMRFYLQTCVALFMVNVHYWNPSA